MEFKEFYTCPHCGGAISGEKKEFFVCPDCGSALCKKEKLGQFINKFCGKCGYELVRAKMELKEFYTCKRCGKAISGEKKEFFVCPDCGSALCKKEKLEQFTDDFCIACGCELTSAKKEALALVEEDC